MSMIFGICTTKSEVVIAETKGSGLKFVISGSRSVRFEVRSGDDLIKLLHTLTGIFDHGGKNSGFVVALLKCSSGRFGSCLEAIKAETITELSAYQTGVQLVEVAPQSLKKSLGCASDQKWRDRAADLFNPDGQHLDWSKALAGAASVAYKVAGG
jgi:hypothetical protein